MVLSHVDGCRDCHTLLMDILPLDNMEMYDTRIKIIVIHVAAPGSKYIIRIGISSVKLYYLKCYPIF